jgi:copper transporter 1
MQPQAIMSMNMDMSMGPSSTGITMTDMSMVPTATGMAPMATSSGGMGGMGDGGMDMAEMMGGCKISVSVPYSLHPDVSNKFASQMLWNWNVIDTCFIAESWHVRSKAMFAGSCIGVILLVILLEFLRRAAKEYDRYIVQQHSKTLASSTIGSFSSSSSSHNNGSTTKDPAASTSQAACSARAMTTSKFRPSILQQAIRAALHMGAFAVAYFVMLLAMYYNGYFIICIFIGAYLGYFIFGWESFNVGNGGEDRMQENATVCCG